jgi:hypothetical protein
VVSNRRYSAVVAGSTVVSDARTRIGLYVSCGTTLTAKDCPSVPGRHSIFAGAIGMLEINPTRLNLDTMVYNGISFDWPAGLTVEAGTVSDGEYSIVPGLVDRFNL